MKHCDDLQICFRFVSLKNESTSPLTLKRIPRYKNYREIRRETMKISTTTTLAVAVAGISLIAPVTIESAGFFRGNKGKDGMQQPSLSVPIEKEQPSSAGAAFSVWAPFLTPSPPRKRGDVEAIIHNARNAGWICYDAVFFVCKNENLLLERHECMAFESRLSETFTSRKGLSLSTDCSTMEIFNFDQPYVGEFQFERIRSSASDYPFKTQNQVQQAPKKSGFFGFFSRKKNNAQPEIQQATHDACKFEFNVNKLDKSEGTNVILQFYVPCLS